MKSIIVNSGDAFRADRLDPAFFIARHELGEAPARLETQFPRGTDGQPSPAIVERLALFSTADKQVLAPLRRTSNPGRPLDLDDIRRVEAEYPYLSLAMLLRHLGPRLEERRAAIQRQAAALADLTNLWVEQAAIANPEAAAPTDESPEEPNPASGGPAP